MTEFFSGGWLRPFAAEERLLVPSPFEVDAYDEKPEMNGAIVVDKAIAAVGEKKYDFIVVNFAGPDMVAHTGDLAATIEAVQAVDESVGKLERSVREQGGAMLVVSDHGNCELLEQPEAEPHKAHTDSLVPFVYVNDDDRDVKLRNKGRLCDVAPTMLELLGLAKPQAMTGQSLLQPASKAP